MSEEINEFEEKPAEPVVSKFSETVHDSDGTVTADGILPETPVSFYTPAEADKEGGDGEKNSPEDSTPDEIIIPGFSVSENGTDMKVSPGELPHAEMLSSENKASESKENEIFAENETSVENEISEENEISGENDISEENEILSDDDETEDGRENSAPVGDRDETDDTILAEEDGESTNAAGGEDILEENEESGEESTEDAEVFAEEAGAPAFIRDDRSDAVTAPEEEREAPAPRGVIPENPREVIGVRFRSAGKIYYFSPGDLRIRRGMHVIVETARGLEYGTVAGNPLVVTKKQFNKPLRVVTRIATPEDDARHIANREKEKTAYRIARERIEKHGLEMKLVSAEYTFDGSKIMFYFTADGRIDFRDLVKDLAGVFRTRIELRQIGVRDETRLLGGYGPCGRELCCASFLNDFAPVSIKMAKEQNLSLNPAKISGVCGRLMCCLKNEEETYEELNKNLPGVGDEVKGSDGLIGEVESVNVLRQTIRAMVDVGDEKEIHEYGVGDFEITRKRRRGDRRHKMLDGAGAEKAAAAMHGVKKPLSTVAAAVAAKQREEAQNAGSTDASGNASTGPAQASGSAQRQGASQRPGSMRNPGSARMSDALHSQSDLPNADGQPEGSGEGTQEERGARRRPNRRRGRGNTPGNNPGNNPGSHPGNNPGDNNRPGSASTEESPKSPEDKSREERPARREGREGRKRDGRGREQIRENPDSGAREQTGSAQDGRGPSRAGENPENNLSEEHRENGQRRHRRHGRRNGGGSNSGAVREGTEVGSRPEGGTGENGRNSGNGGNAGNTAAKE